MHNADADYVGMTTRRLHQRIVEYQYSSIGNHFREHHNSLLGLKSSQFYVFKCSSKFNCIVYEMLFIRKLKPSLNLQHKVTQLMQNVLLNFYCFLLYFILILIHIFYCTLAPIVYLSYIVSIHVFQVCLLNNCTSQSGSTGVFSCSTSAASLTCNTKIQ